MKELLAVGAAFVIAWGGVTVTSLLSRVSWSRPPQVTCARYAVLRDSVAFIDVPTSGNQPWTQIQLFDAETNMSCWTHE